MTVNSGLAFVRYNNVAGATKQYFTMLIQLSVEVRAILLNKICKILQLPCRFVNSAHDGKILRTQNRRILTSLTKSVNGLKLVEEGLTSHRTHYSDNGLKA